ncbi:MAG: phage terminase large subunit [Eubacteriales bacterium]|nr:phage terminase large subunit [Christensenellaceae bacterium]MEA5067151.1 phage terminase large subunit [Eubacteriales bacterium]
MAEIRVPLTSLIAPPFFPVHNDIKRGDHAEYWLKGGRGSTKSSFLSVEIILGMLRDPEANAIIYRKIADTLRESVYAQMLWAIDRLGVAQYFRAKVSPMEITYTPTGQRILFRGADDPGKSKSIKLREGYFKYLWFEELSEFAGIDDIRTIKASIIRGGGQAITLYSYNPPISARNWVNTEALVARDDRLVHHSDYTQVPAEWLGESFIAEAEALQEVNKRAYRHVYLGEVTGTGGSVFENVVTREVTDAEIKTFGATYAGLDFGWYPDPLHFVRCAYFPGQQRLVIYDEYRAWKQTNYDAFRHMVDAKGLTPAEEVIADSAEQKSVADMRAYGMNCVGATKGPGTMSMRIKWLQGLREIVIDPVRCPHAAKEFLEYEYERTRAGEIVAAYPDRDNHAIDAVGYALNRVWLTRGA